MSTTAEKKSKTKQVLRVGLDLGTCSATDNWNVTSCFNECGAYLDVHSCEHDGSNYGCTGCDETCVYMFGISEGCDEDAYCDFYLIGGDCIRKAADGGACDGSECRRCPHDPSGPVAPFRGSRASRGRYPHRLEQAIPRRRWVAWAREGLKTL